MNCERTKEAIIIDPGFGDSFEAEEIFSLIDEYVLTVKYIVNTHGHPDHTSGNRIVREKFRAPILIHEFDVQLARGLGNGSSPPATTLLHDEDWVRFGAIALKVLHTPGHTRGSISLLGEKEVFTGDTLFSGSIGRTDFPESSELEMESSLRKLAGLPTHLTVYPGHGPLTNLGQEKRSNPFLQRL